MNRPKTCGGLVVALALAAALASTTLAGGLAEVERYLPKATFMYGGVEKLGASFDRITQLIDTNVPVFQGRKVAAIVLHELGRELGAGAGVLTTGQFADAMGLDPDGAAGIAWVLADPSVDPGRSMNENVLLILPVRNAQQIEKVMIEHILPEMLGETPRHCRYNRRRVLYAKRRLAQLRKEGKLPDGTVSWKALVEANPGLPVPRCPGGGEYDLGDGITEPTCSVHSRPDEARPDGPFDKAILGVKTVGNATLVGGRSKGTGYAITPTHVIFSNNMNVLEDALAAAELVGGGAKALPAPASTGPAAGEARGFINSALLFDMGKAEIQREVDRGRHSPQALRRLMVLLDAPGGVTLDARIAQLEPANAQRLHIAATWDMKANAMTQEWLATPPTDLAAWKLLPASSLFAVGTNLARPTFAVLAEIAMLEEPAMAGAVRLLMAGADGDGAFAMTPGIFAEDMPNMVLVLRVKDKAMMDAALETWLAMFAKEMQAEKGIERSALPGNVPLQSIHSARGPSVHVAYIGLFAVACSSLDDMKAIAAIGQGNAAGALTASAAYRKLGGQDGPANAVMFLDVPRLVREMAVASHERSVRWCNQNCQRNLKRIDDAVAKFKADKGRFPADLKELMAGGANKAKGVRRFYVPTTCYLSGTGPAKYTLDAAAGHASCPRHGMLVTFKPVTSAAPRRRGSEEMFLSPFGVSVLRLRLEDGKFKGEGTLIPAPQRQAERGSM
ncbi:hypothetical protein HQ576_12095 [bacterium]|nr:hypothetical protein [bacterium]